MNTKEIFVPFTIAEKLKEDGFNEPCLAVYTGGKKLKIPFEIESATTQYKAEKIFLGGILAPIYQQAVDYFRKNHKLVITVNSFKDGTFHWSIKRLKGDIYSVSHEHINQGEFKKYYKAFDNAIDEAFKIKSK